MGCFNLNKYADLEEEINCSYRAVMQYKTVCW